MAEKKIFVISDTHFWHTRIIGYENRPFKSVQEMNEEIIKRWNEKVSKDDVIFHLGDFCFGNQKITSEIVQRLNGKKVLIMGNHDETRNVKWFMDCGFDEVYRYPIMYNNYFILSHEPISYLKSPFVNLYGHVHGSPNNPTFTKNSVCCCVERWNYAPINFTTIMRNIEKLQRQIDATMINFQPSESINEQ